MKKNRVTRVRMKDNYPRSVGELTLPRLLESLARCERAILNPKLNELTIRHHKQRREMLKAEIRRRS